MTSIARPIAALLVAAWLGSFAPPALSGLAASHWPAEWARHLAAGWPGLAPVLSVALGWLVAGALLRTLPGAAHAFRALALVAGGVVLVRFTWLAGLAGNAELFGALLAVAVWPAAERLPAAWLERLLVAATAVTVLYLHLAPHASAPHVQRFHWLPFTDLARPGGAGIAVALACGKVFWYGGLVWLLAAAGLGASVAGLAVAAAVLVTEVLRLGTGPAVQYMTTTDAAIALATGLSIALLARVGGGR